MSGRFQRLRMLAWSAGMAIFLMAGPVSAAIINLSAYVYLALLNEDGSAPLADGSIVQIIGSFDDIIDPIEEVGSGLTGNTTGDDIILATITINSADLGSNGTFYVSNIYYESDDIKNMYIRFYDSQGPLTGLIAWGQSPITNVEYDAFGSIVVDFIGGYSTTNTDTFVVIPEPNTLNYLLMWAGMIAALRSSMKREGRKSATNTVQKLLEPQPTLVINTYDRF